MGKGNDMRSPLHAAATINRLASRFLGAHGSRHVAQRAVLGKPSLRRFDSADYYSGRQQQSFAPFSPASVLSPARAYEARVWPADVTAEDAERPSPFGDVTLAQSQSDGSAFAFGNPNATPAATNATPEEPQQPAKTKTKTMTKTKKGLWRRTLSVQIPCERSQAVAPHPDASDEPMAAATGGADDEGRPFPPDMPPLPPPSPWERAKGTDLRQKHLALPPRPPPRAIPVARGSPVQQSGGDDQRRRKAAPGGRGLWRRATAQSPHPFAAAGTPARQRLQWALRRRPRASVPSARYSPSARHLLRTQRRRWLAAARELAAAHDIDDAQARAALECSGGDAAAAGVMLMRLRRAAEEAAGRPRAAYDARSRSHEREARATAEQHRLSPMSPAFWVSESKAAPEVSESKHAFGPATPHLASLLRRRAASSGESTSGKPPMRRVDSVQLHKARLCRQRRERQREQTQQEQKRQEREREQETKQRQAEPRDPFAAADGRRRRFGVGGRPLRPISPLMLALSVAESELAELTQAQDRLSVAVVHADRALRVRGYATPLEVRGVAITPKPARPASSPLEAKEADEAKRDNAEPALDESRASRGCVLDTEAMEMRARLFGFISPLPSPVVPPAPGTSASSSGEDKTDGSGRSERSDSGLSDFSFPSEICSISSISADDSDGERCEAFDAVDAAYGAAGPAFERWEPVQFNGSTEEPRKRDRAPLVRARP